MEEQGEFEVLRSDPRSIGGAGSAAAVATGGPASPAAAVADPRVPEQMEGIEEKDVVGNLIRTLNDETTTRVTIAAHGSYSEKPSSYTCDSYVIETSLYGEIFYVIKIKYINLFFTNSEQLAHLFTSYPIHSIISDYDHTSTLFNEEAIGRLSDNNGVLKALRGNNKAFIQKLGEYIRDLLLKGNWKLLRTYMGDELYHFHSNHLARLENCLTACTIYPPGSTIYTRNLTMNGPKGKEEWARVNVTGRGEASGDRTEEEPFRSLFTRDNSTTTERVIDAVDMHTTPVRDKCVYIFISCGARDTVTDDSPIEKEQYQRRLDFNASRDDTSGPEEGMLNGFDIDTVTVTLGQALTLELAVRTHEAQLDRGPSGLTTNDEHNAYLAATENYNMMKNPDTSIRCDDTHPIGVLLEGGGPYTLEPVVEEERYTFPVKVDSIQRTTVPVLLWDLIDRPSRRYYIKIQGELRVPSLVPVFSLLQKYLPAGTSVDTFFSKITEHGIHKYAYVEWINLYAENIFKQEDIEGEWNTFDRFLTIFNPLKEILKRKKEYVDELVKTYRSITELEALAYGLNPEEDSMDTINSIIISLGKTPLISTDDLNTFISELKPKARAITTLQERIKAIYDTDSDLHEQGLEEAVDRVVYDEEIEEDTIKKELKDKLVALLSLKGRLKGIVGTCLVHQGSSRSTRSSRKALKTSTRKTKKRKLKSCLTRRSRYPRAESTLNPMPNKTPPHRVSRRATFRG